MRRVLLLFVPALAFAPKDLLAQGMPLGPEFRVNTYTTGFQIGASVAADAAGNFVVVWRGPSDGSSYGVFGQRYDSSGMPLGPEFRVNTYTTGAQNGPSVAADDSGSFVVVWESDDQDGSSYGTFGQRYDSSGTPLGPEFRVNSYTTSSQFEPSVTAAGGGFVVVWNAVQQGGFGVFGQRYASSGVPLGPEFRVNTYTTDLQFRASVAADPSGNFVVVWQGSSDGSSYGVFGRHYDSSGTPLGPEFRVNTYTTSYQGQPAVAADDSGNFVVVWRSDYQDGDERGVFAQRYASSGAPAGPEFRVNGSTAGSQHWPSVAADAAGNLVVVWHFSGSPVTEDVLGQRYAASGTPLGSEFRVNTYTTNSQAFSSVAADATGDFVVVWSSAQPADPDGGIFGQRYAEIVPVGLIRLSVE